MSNWALTLLRRVHVAVDLQSFEDGRFLCEAVGSFIMCLELVYRELLVQEQLDGQSLLHSRMRTMVSSALTHLIHPGSSDSTCRPSYFILALLVDYNVVNM
jgi:hypothetical protein